MGQRSDGVVIPAGDLRGPQPMGLQQSININHNVNINGVAVPWPGPPMPGAHSPQAVPVPIEDELGISLARLGSSRTMGIASLTGGATIATASTVAVCLLGAPVFILGALVPAALLLTVGSMLTLRKASPSEPAMSETLVLESAQRRGGTLTVVTLALDTRRPMAECQQRLDAMVAAGWATMDVDDQGILTYRIASLSP